MIQKASSTPAAAASWSSRALSAPWRGVLLCGPMLAELAVAVIFLLAVALIPVFLGFMVMPGCLLAIRHEAERARRLTRRTTGTEIAAWYRPEPMRTGKGARWRTDLPWLLKDPTTWRDLLWLFVNPTVGWVLTLIPAALVLWGLFGVVMPDAWKPIVDAGANNWYGPIHVTTTSSAWACVPLGVAFVLAGFAVGPALLAIYDRFAAVAAGTEPPGRTRHAGRATGREPQRGGRSPSRRDPKDRTRPPRRGAGSASGHGHDARGCRTTPRA